MLPVLLGTVIIAFMAMLVALPMGLFSAIYLAELHQNVQNIIKQTLGTGIQRLLVILQL